MRKRPRQGRSAFTVDVIVEAATRLLGKEGHSLTTNRVAQLAGVSVGSVYQYFGGKQAIFDEIARRHLAAAEESINEVLERNPVGAQPWEDVLGELVAVIVAENRSHGPAHGRLRNLVDARALAPAFEAFLGRLTGAFAEYLYADGRSEAEAREAAELAMITVDAQVHHLAQTALDDAIIAARITDYTVRALSIR